MSRTQALAASVRRGTWATAALLLAACSGDDIERPVLDRAGADDAGVADAGAEADISRVEAGHGGSESGPDVIEGGLAAESDAEQANDARTDVVASIDVSRGGAEADAPVDANLASDATTDVSFELEAGDERASGEGAIVVDAALMEEAREASADVVAEAVLAADATAERSPDATDGNARDAADALDSSDGADARADAADGAPDAGIYVPATGGYQVRAAALIDGTQAVTHALASADFYVAALDPQFGGVFTFLDRQGHATASNKSFGVQGRDAYAFARAFMLSGNEAYLAAARSTLDFLYGHGWDAVRGGFYFWGDQQGNPLARPVDAPSDKWSYAQNYALVGITAMCEATRSALDCDWMDRAIGLLDTRYRDTSAGRTGYYDNANLDLSVLSGKGFNPSVDALTTHGLYAFLIAQRPADRARFLSLADDAATHLVANMSAPGVAFGFPETYLSDWSIDTSNHSGFVGHLFKTAWALGRAYLVAPDLRYRDGAARVLRQMYEGGGFDRVNGAPNSSFDWTTGVTSSDKEYWQLEQAVTSGLLNWYIAQNDTDRAVFLEMADRSLDFFMTHLPDRQFGAIFFTTNADGSAILRQDKGDQWEGSYHNVELAYYTYLYGNLLFWRKPVTLHYRLDAAQQARSFVLTPLAIENDRLLITGVTLAGQPYAAFDAVSRTLSVPAGASGIFAVTFAHTL